MANSLTNLSRCHKICHALASGVKITSCGSKIIRSHKSLFLTLIVLLIISSCSGGRLSLPPILVLATDSDFGSYTCEILKAEGFNEFLHDSLSDKKITSEYLNQFDVVILGETVVTKSRKKILSDYVKNGGNLIAFKPDKQLSEIFGIVGADETVKEGYIRINTSDGTGKGLVPVTMQFHGISDTYTLNGAAKIASLYKNASDSTRFAAVMVNNYGRGHSAAFAYNLPKSIVYTRQGNPDWAGEERDRIDGPTPTDMFFPRDGEIQWNDPGKIAIPQADEQMRLLSHIIEKLNTYKKPLPRFWYFPDRLKCVFIFTIDGEESPEDEINKEIIEVQSKGGMVTLYEIGTYIKPATVATWRSAGHEVAIHFNDVPNYSAPDYLNMSTVFDTMITNFRNAYGLSPVTTRNHWAVWCSKDQSGARQFAEQALIEEKYGIGFDCNYYQFGGYKTYPNWLGDIGHFTGSGIPMKFAGANGRIINVYQSNTQLPDETWLRENIESKSKTLIDRSLDEENYVYINANFHTWYWGESRQAGLRVLDYCNSRGVPVWTAEKVYKFLKMKDEALFKDIIWANKHLTFTLSSTVKNPEGLTILLPCIHGDSEISTVRVNRRKIKFDRISIKGNEYASVTLDPGLTYGISVFYK